jgi:lambda repressor-like predicted transcriptional regulator
MSYYNTTGATNPKLKEYEEKAKSQTEIIYELFKGKKTIWSPSEIEAELKKKGIIILLTSIRRTLSTLSSPKKRKLQKLDAKIVGKHGRPEHLWSYNKEAVPSFWCKEQAIEGADQCKSQCKFCKNL